MKTSLKKIITVVGLCSPWLVASSIASDIPDTNLSVGTEVKGSKLRGQTHFHKQNLNTPLSQASQNGYTINHGLK